MHEENTKNSRSRISVDLVPVRSEDREFLLTVYEAAREIELSIMPWNAEQKRVFAANQFAAQLDYYTKEFPGAKHDLIIMSITGQRVGRVYVDRTSERIIILDITVLPEFRRRGIGSTIVDDLIDEAARSEKSVQVYVESFNPSLSFFQSRGFVIEHNDGVKLRLLCSPDVSDGTIRVEAR